MLFPDVCVLVLIGNLMNGHLLLGRTQPSISFHLSTQTVARAFCPSTVATPAAHSRDGAVKSHRRSQTKKANRRPGPGTSPASHRITSFVSLFRPLHSPESN